VAKARQVGRYQHLLKLDNSTAKSQELPSSPAPAGEVRLFAGRVVC